jgi:hypothetical protein
MLTFYAGHFLRAYILFSLVVFLCTGYVYRVNSRRKADDPEKRDYPFSAVTLTLAWPVLLLAMAVFFILRALAYGLFLILFTVVLIFARKPIILTWLIKTATKIGTLFLKVNTYLIRIFFPATRPQPT